MQFINLDWTWFKKTGYARPFDLLKSLTKKLQEIKEK